MRLGIVQGRLMPPVDGRIQAFPADAWRDELGLCARAGFDGVEWIDDGPDPRNPITRSGGWREIAEACTRESTRVLSGCYDALLTPRVIEDGPASASWARHFDGIRVLSDNLAALGARHLVLPLLGQNRLSEAGWDVTVSFVRGALSAAAPAAIEVHLETAWRGAALHRLFGALADPRCRVTFDTGNVVQFGYDWREELVSQLPLIGSVHLKDSTPEGTVPLGTGRVDFSEAARLLRGAGYEGDCIVQGARVPGASEVDVARQYATLVRAVFS